MLDPYSTFIAPHIRPIAGQTWKYDGVDMKTKSPICLTGQAFARQIPTKTTQGGVYTDHVSVLFHDVVHGSDSNRACRSHLSVTRGLAVFTFS